MTYTDTVTKIRALESEIEDWQRVYRQLRLELEAADREVMARLKEKWRLERDIVPVTKVSTAKPRVKKVEVEEIDLDKLTPRQLEALLVVMRAREEQITIEEVEEEESENDN